MEKLFCFFIAITALTACSQLNKDFGLEDDNPIEQRIEDEIEKDTGIEVDFTPNHPEGPYSPEDFGQ